jgi:hypothetical protein
MKKAISITFAVLGIVFLSSMIINTAPAPSSQKDGTASKLISSSVMKIAKKSCVKCHSESGNGMAMIHLNLSNWDKFSAEKQAEKAKDMCKMVLKDKMPPQGFREKNPGAAPTKVEAKNICDWATSIQVKKNKTAINR